MITQITELEEYLAKSKEFLSIELGKYSKLKEQVAINKENSKIGRASCRERV